MKRFRSLIDPLSGKDDGQSAVDQAAILAIQNDATVTLVDAINPIYEFLNITGTTSSQLHSDTAEQVLQRVQYSVITVKPDWFLASIATVAKARSRLFDGLQIQNTGLI